MRKQFWALRRGLTWERIQYKTPLPIDRIKSVWASYVDDPVFFCTLVPSEVDRPAAERWAHEFEVVGLTGHKKNAAVLYRKLEDEARRESERRARVGKDMAQMVRTFVAEQESRYKNHVSEFQEALTKTTTNDPQAPSARSLFSREWGTSYVRVVRSEAARKCAHELLGSLDAGATPIDAVEHATGRVLERVRSGRLLGSGSAGSGSDRAMTGHDLMNALLTGRSVMDHVERTLVSAGELDFVTAATALCVQLRDVYEAQRIQREIDEVRRGTAEHVIPPLPPKPKRARRVRCHLCREIVPAAGSHKRPDGGWIGECCWGKPVVEPAAEPEAEAVTTVATTGRDDSP